MVINGHEIPSRWCEIVNDEQLYRSFIRSELHKEFDAYGNHLETEIGEIYRTAEVVQQESAKLPEHFQADGYYGESASDLAGPGAILDILDFSHIICFGTAGDGSPFCLDYRDTPSRPSVIWWDDVYWRRLAPDIESFLTLFKRDAF